MKDCFGKFNMEDQQCIVCKDKMMCIPEFRKKPTFFLEGKLASLSAKEQMRVFTETFGVTTDWAKVYRRRIPEIVTIENYIGFKSKSQGMRNCFVIGFNETVGELGKWFGQVFYPPQNYAIDLINRSEWNLKTKEYYDNAYEILSKVLKTKKGARAVIKFVRNETKGHPAGIVALGMLLAFKSRSPNPVPWKIYDIELRNFVSRASALFSKIEKPENFVRLIPQEVDVVIRYFTYGVDVVNVLFNNSFVDFTHQGKLNFRVDPQLLPGAHTGINLNGAWIYEW